jgi:hypothetical protein
MKKQFAFAVLISGITIASCDRIKEGAKEVINKGGETAGKTATEFFEGVSEGVDKTLQCEITFSKALLDKGLRSGQFAIGSDSAGKNNLLTLYIIFEKDFNGPVSVKAFTREGLECGRTQAVLEGRAGEAKYYDFRFDRRTDIGARSRITLE